MEAFLSANHYDPDVTVEMFLLKPSDNGDAAVDVHVDGAPDGQAAY